MEIRTFSNISEFVPVSTLKREFELACERVRSLRDSIFPDNRILSAIRTDMAIIDAIENEMVCRGEWDSE